MSGRDICLLVYALACLKVKPSPAWQQSVMEAARLRFW